MICLLLASYCRQSYITALSLLYFSYKWDAHDPSSLCGDIWRQKLMKALPRLAFMLIDLRVKAWWGKRKAFAEFLGKLGSKAGCTLCNFKLTLSVVAEYQLILCDWIKTTTSDLCAHIVREIGMDCDKICGVSFENVSHSETEVIFSHALALSRYRSLYPSHIFMSAAGLLAGVFTTCYYCGGIRKSFLMLSW